MIKTNYEELKPGDLVIVVAYNSFKTDYPCCTINYGKILYENQIHSFAKVNVNLNFKNKFMEINSIVTENKKRNIYPFLQYFKSNSISIPIAKKLLKNLNDD